MLTRTTSLSEADAVVAFPSESAAKALGDHLDDAFGADGWRAATLKAAPGLATKVAAAGGRFLLVGLHEENEAEIALARAAIDAAKAEGMKVVLLAETIGPATIHALIRAGADDFAPLPLPSGALTETVSRLRFAAHSAPRERDSRNGMILPVCGVAGGVGATTFSVNLAWELAQETAKKGLKVAILDFNFQYGTVSTYLDMPRREAIYELLSDTSTLDAEGISQALTTYNDRLSVLTAPMDVLPLDIIGPDDVREMLELVRRDHDFVIVDMPQTLTHWSDLVLTDCEEFFAIMQIDMRSAQNMLRFLRVLKAEELPIEKISVVLNRAPGFTEMSGRSRATRLEKSLGVEFAVRLPDGGKQVVTACDHGAPLARAAKNNPLRKEIRKVAQRIVKMAEAAKAEA